MQDAGVKVGGREVFAAGTILSRVGESIDIQLPPASSSDYIVGVYFKSDPEKPSSWVSWQLESQTRFGVTFTNFLNPFWTSTIDPVYVANSFGRKVMMHLAVALTGQIDNGLRLINYSLFDGGPSNG